MNYLEIPTYSLGAWLVLSFFAGIGFASTVVILVGR
jgi:hypothetical protein